MMLYWKGRGFFSFLLEQALHPSQALFEIPKHTKSLMKLYFFKLAAKSTNLSLESITVESIFKDDLLSEIVSDKLSFSQPLQENLVNILEELQTG